ncbi:MAG: hypothetical protein HYS60_02880 [Candidatus Wildermuthbacteria bacterium]|nr:hypothetical protein [Candidatus Wildermuthbacteria bacterium]
MENEFITIAEAAKLTGESDIVLVRAIKERLQSSGLPLESIMKKEQRERGFMYLISKDFLLQALSGASENPVSPQAMPEDPLAHSKNEMIGTLQKIIETKDRQMEDLLKKIDELIERDRETNILMKGLQDRLFLLEQAREEKPAAPPAPPKNGKNKN